MVQRYSPEGWRDIKIGSGIATLFAHNSQGQLLSEQNHPLDALTQDTRHEVQNVLVAQLAQAIGTGHPLTEPVAEQAAEILYATLEEQHNNDEIQNLVIDTIQSLVEQLPGLNAQLPSLSDQATRLASAEAKWRIKPHLREYIYLQGQPLAMITSRQTGAPNELFTIHTDHLGTPVWVTDGLGAQRVWDPILEPFGNIHQEDTPAIQGTQESLESDLDTISNHTSTEAQQAIDISMPLRFAGQYFDTETQLHYNYYRDYDPSIGRYVQSDPIGLAGGVNTYGYVGGNPVGFVDPLGLEKWDYDGMGDTSVCVYYDELSSQTACDYYEVAAAICRGERSDVNFVLRAGITQAWIADRTSDSQSEIFNQIRNDLIALDNTTRILNSSGDGPLRGDLIDMYHHIAFEAAGISTFFYGGNLWPQGVFPNPVPFDPIGNSELDPRRLRFLWNDGD